MMQRVFYRIFTVVCFWVISCSQETAIPVQADFSIAVENEDYSVPVRINITDLSQDADTYQWTFEGGSPPSSTDRNPGTIQYSNAGNYTIKLDVANRDGSTATKTFDVSLDSQITMDFEPMILENNFPPVTVNLVNNTAGANSYSWTFEGGAPSTSQLFQPQDILFDEPGEYMIVLEASNGRESYQLEKVITVAPQLLADFEFTPNFEDDDFQAPVTLMMENLSIGAIHYSWNFDEGNPNSSTSETPIVTFPEAGSYALELTAGNGKLTQTVSKNVTIFPDTNLRVLQNIRLGVNSAHNSNTFGAFFSTQTRQVYNEENASSVDGALVDIVFFGLDADFGFNKFLSPDQAQDLGFSVIPSSGNTKFINLQEDCDCDASLSIQEFDSMEDDTLLESLTIEETIGGIQDFDGSIVPRIVLFESQDGRKGAIKIKEFVADGASSHIVMDIKVQKQ
nr:PKD domain-containing protein [uncultured Allomuricauda sp.]